MPDLIYTRVLDYEALEANRTDTSLVISTESHTNYQRMPCDAVGVTLCIGRGCDSRY
jgi:hypothetical protein